MANLFCDKKSPLERISETFFSRYGNKETIYFGTQGLKNFSNDVFYGRKRHMNLNIQTMTWPLCKNSDLFISHEKVMGKNKAPAFASIIYAESERVHYLHTELTSENSTNEKAAVPASLNFYYIIIFILSFI